MNNEQFEQRLSAIEYELSQIAESDYLEELKEKFSGGYGKDVVVNIIPSRDISFKTRSLLSSILDRLELTHQDRLDLEKYIVYGGGDNIENIKTEDNINLKVFNGNYIVYNKKSSTDPIYYIGDYISYLFWNGNVYKIPETNGESINVNGSALIIKRTSKSEVEITGYALNSLASKPIYFGNISGILSRLDILEQKVNKIINGTN